jgi:hypothetical protein
MDGHGNELRNGHGNEQTSNHGNDDTEELGHTNDGNDANAMTLDNSIELVKQNKPLLDRLGRFGKVLESLLEIGTVASEVISWLLSVLRFSNTPI